MSITGFLKTLVLLGALQGFISSALLWSSARRRPEERTSRRLLAVIVLLIALACLDLCLDESAWENQTAIGSIFNAVVPLIIIMPIGPLVYFYVRSLGEPGFRMERRYRPHFYTVVIDLFQHFVILCFIVVAFIGSWLKLFHHHDFGPQMRWFGAFLDDYNQYADIPRWISLTLYLGLATRYLRRQAGSGEWRRLPTTFLRVFWAFDVIWFIFLIPYELPRIGDLLLDKVDWFPLYLPMVVIIYFLGIKGYFITYRTEPLPVADRKSPVMPLPEEKVEPVIRALKQSMEADGLWLNPDLNLTRLAEHCRVTPKVLSAVLNQHMDTTFHEFVNGYRIGAVKERLRQPTSRELTIAGLAYDCGFNSLPTFQRAFKATTGQSPKEFMANCDQIRI